MTVASKYGWAQESQHRIGTYMEGCRCDQCCEAGRDHGRRMRRTSALRRAKTETPVCVCRYCSHPFWSIGGMNTHISKIHEP